MMSVMSHTSLGGGLRCFSRRTAKMAFDRAMSSLGIPDGWRIAPMGLPTTRNATDAVRRVSALRCRMLSRGLQIPPVNSGGWGGGGLDGDFCPTPARFSYRAPY